MRPLSKAAAAFGGGMGRMQKTCGAVTGAYIWFGLNYGTPGLPEESDKIRVYDRVKRFNRILQKGTDAISRSELLGEDLNTPDGKARIKERGLTKRYAKNVSPMPLR